MKTVSITELAKGGDHLVFEDQEDYEVVAKGCILDHCRFNTVGLRNAKFVDAKIMHCTFSCCYMKYAVFESSDLTGTRFVNCDLRYASFAGTKLWYVDFDGCQLDYAQLLECLPVEINLRKELLQRLRLNAEKMGERKLADKIQLLELYAERKEQLCIFTSATRYFAEKYEIYDRLVAFRRWAGHHIRSFVWGYGLRLRALLRTAALVVLLFGVLYWVFGARFADLGEPVPQPIGFFRALYFSAVTFSTLGLGDLWSSDCVARFLVAAESLCGCVFLAFFAAAMYRRIAR